MLSMDFDKLINEMVSLSNQHSLIVWDYVDLPTLSAMTISLVSDAWKKDEADNEVAIDIIYLWYPTLRLVDSYFLDLDLEVEEIVRKAKYPIESKSDVAESECERCGRTSHIVDECYAKTTNSGEYIDDLSSEDGDRYESLSDD